MATGTISVMTNESGNDYCKMPDGTLMMWQDVAFASGDYAKSLYWAGRFTSIKTIMLSTDATEVTTMGAINDSNTVVVARRPATTACTVRCLAIGRWK